MQSHSIYKTDEKYNNSNNHQCGMWRDKEIINGISITKRITENSSNINISRVLIENQVDPIV